MFLKPYENSAYLYMCVDLLIMGMVRIKYWFSEWESIVFCNDGEDLELVTFVREEQNGVGVKSIDILLIEIIEMHS